MKHLIAISTCYDFELNGSNQAMRDTWLADVKKCPGVDYRFFMGHGQGASFDTLPPDAVFLPDVPDDYGHLTYKTRSSLRWAAERGYDFVFRCFPDTYVRLDRLMACGFEQHDYYGDFRGDPRPTKSRTSARRTMPRAARATGCHGAAYVLLLDAPVLGVWRDEIMPYTEDLWTGNILGRHLDIKLRYFDDTLRFMNRGSRSCAWPTPSNQIIRSHLSCPDHPYVKERMHAAHRIWA